MDIIKYILIWFCVGGIVANFLVSAGMVTILAKDITKSDRVKIVLLLMSTALPAFLGALIIVAFRKS